MCIKKRVVEYHTCNGLQPECNYFFETKDQTRRMEGRRMHLPPTKPMSPTRPTSLNRPKSPIKSYKSY